MKNLRDFFSAAGLDMLRFGTSYLVGFVVWCASYSLVDGATLTGVPEGAQVLFWLTYGSGVNALGFLAGWLSWKFLGGLGWLVRGIRNLLDRRREPEFDRA